MQERLLQIKTSYKSLFLTGLSGTEGLCRSSSLATLFSQKSQLVGKSISAKVITNESRI